MKKEGKIEYIPEESTEGAEGKIKKIKEQLKNAEKERNEYLAGWQRARADYINLEKRINQEKEEWIKFSNLNFVLEILPTLDSFDKALEHFKDDPESPESTEQNGIEQIYKQLKSTLESKGLEEINALGEKFDPELHEAVGKVEGEEGKVVEEILKGYKLNGKVIRPSKVKIGK